MRNRRGAVVYVGKAKNLRSRVRQYFGSGSDTRATIPFLVKETHEVDVIVVTSEKEALLLENNLIKEHKPKYNVILKDDKSYISLKINHKHKWPTIRLVRYKGKPKPDGWYFGPYSSAYAARETLELLHRLFPLRQCSDQELARRDRPCILYQMHRCVAPCVGLVSEEEYQNLVRRTARFLRGHDKEILKELEADMQEASDALEFERAGEILRKIRHLERTVEKQRVEKIGQKDTDVLGLFREGEDLVVTRMLFRGGKLMGTEHHAFTGLAQEDDEVLESFILQHYDGVEPLPYEILLPVSLADQRSLEELLGELTSHKVAVVAPQKGDKLALIEMAYANAVIHFRQRKDRGLIVEKTLLEMQDKFRLQNYPNRIECFDNSNISGEHPVSAMVAFKEGEKETKRYRKFRIKGTQQLDDYAYMREVLTRRYKRAKEENDFPDLLIVDGGKGHLNLALKVLEELDVTTVDVIGVAKEHGRHDKGMTGEQVFLPNRKDAIRLARHSSVLFLLQRIRDEAHRVAIGFHRQRRAKKLLTSQVDEIPGIGPVKKKVLLMHFGSVRQILQATEAQLVKVPGLTRQNVEAILHFIEERRSPQ